MQEQESPASSFLEGNNTETISVKVDSKRMMGLGHHTAVGATSYRLEDVPLKLGVKINPDDRYFSAEALETYRYRAVNVMKDAIAEEQNAMALALQATKEKIGEVSAEELSAAAEL